MWALLRQELRAPEHQDGIQDRLAKEAGVQGGSRKQKLSRGKVTPHILRNSHVVNALVVSVPVLIGHKRLSATEIHATVALAPGEGGV